MRRIVIIWLTAIILVSCVAEQVGAPATTASVATAPVATPDASVDTPVIIEQPTSPETSTPPQPTDTPPPTSTPSAESLDDFVNRLKAAIDGRDFGTIQTLMADPFTVGYWLSEGVSVSPSEATTQFETNLLPEGAAIRWADESTDLTSLLQGQPPATFLGPDKALAAALLSYGWGPDGNAEGIVFISQQPDGAYVWDLLLYSGFGFTGMPTDVEAISIVADEATFYGGPGEDYEPVASVVGGMVYPVSGVSTDGQWWRLVCYDDNNVRIPNCWVSADPAISQATTLP